MPEAMRAEKQGEGKTGMKNTSRTAVLILVLAVFCLTGAAQSAGRWVETAVFQEPGVNTFVWENGTTVYTAPDMQSPVVGVLNTAPADVWDVNVVQVRILVDGNGAIQKDKSGAIQKGWARISRPLKGWVEWQKLGIAASGFIGEVLEFPGDFRAISR